MKQAVSANLSLVLAGACVLVGLIGILDAWAHYPPHHRPLEGLFSMFWPTNWAYYNFVREASRGMVAFGVWLACWNAERD